MSADPKQDNVTPRADTAERAAAVPDERDATIERLQRAVSEERQRSAEMRSTIDDLRFRIEILEKSYSKQLADARARTSEAEHRLAEQNDRLAEANAAREETLLALAKAEARLDHYRYARGSEPSEASTGGALPPRPIAADDPIESSLPEGTINQLLDDADWLRQQPRKEEEQEPRGHEERVRNDDEEQPLEDMLAPELVFSSKDKEGGS